MYQFSPTLRSAGEGAVVIIQQTGQALHFQDLLSGSHSVYRFSPTLRSAGEGTVVITQQGGQALHGVTLLSAHP